MKIQDVKGGGFFIATAPYNWNSVIITDVGHYGPLKVLANSKKYFSGYYPDFFYVSGSKIKKITKVELKSTFRHALEMDPKFFTMAEIQELAKIFKMRIDSNLSEQLKIQFKNRTYPRGAAWSKEHYNIDHSNPREVSRKRTVKARNARKTTTRKRK